MTWIDPIVEEVRQTREAYAAKFNYDLRAIYLDLKKREKEADYKFVNGVAQREPTRPASQTLAG